MKKKTIWFQIIIQNRKNKTTRTKLQLNQTSDNTLDLEWEQIKQKKRSVQ